MNILIGADSLVAPLTGIGNYTFELLSGYLESDDVDNIYGLSRQGVIDPYVLLEKAKKKELNKSYNMRFNIKKIIRKIPGAYQAKAILKNKLLKNSIDISKSNYIYHEPNYILSDFKGPSVSTIHDLSHIHYPDYHPKERVNCLNRELHKTIEKSDKIITVSMFIKSEVIKILGVNKEKVTAISNGVGPQFRPRSQAEVSQLLKNYKLDSGYLLCVSTLEPRKNLDNLITAYLDLPSAFQKRFPLVLVGGEGWCCGDLLKRVSSLHHAGRICYLGYVPAAHLPYLFSGAVAFVYPSVYEGFGLPPLEAMASGIPVIVSNNSAMEEVVADAGMVVNAHDVDQLTRAIENVLDDKALRKDLTIKGLARSRNYSWERCVVETKDLYREVLKTSGA